MSIESLFHDLLGLGTDWRVKELAHLPGAHSEVRIVIEATASLYEGYQCPDDGGSVRHYDYAPVRKWRHLNIFQHECYLECRLPRIQCVTTAARSKQCKGLGGQDKGLHFTFRSLRADTAA